MQDDAEPHELVAVLGVEAPPARHAEQAEGERAEHRQKGQNQDDIGKGAHRHLIAGGPVAGQGGRARTSLVYDRPAPAAGRRGTMSFLDRIAECNTHDLADFLPFAIAGVRVGRVRARLARRLAAYDDVFTVGPDGLLLSPGLADPAARTRAVAPILRALAAEGAIGPWRGEAYAVGRRFGAEALMHLDRGAAPAFGVRAYGAHVNGYVRGRDGLRMWIARRSRGRPTWPGMLDNMVAGGQPAGLGLIENVVKEAGEEAGIPEALARTARPVGAVTYCQEVEERLRRDTIFCYDLELPLDFAPRNRDGEIEAFHLWPIARVMETVAETREFKFNCNLVCIDFFVRHGLTDPEDPDFVDIAAGLRARLCDP